MSAVVYRTISTWKQFKVLSDRFGASGGKNTEYKTPIFILHTTFWVADVQFKTNMYQERYFSPNGCLLRITLLKDIEIIVV